MTNNLKIEVLLPKDPRLTRFREQVYQEDLGIDPKLAETLLSHSECQKLFSQVHLEEAYKFGKKKWDKTDFDGIAVASDQGRHIMSISGFRLYDQFLRVGMHLYTLKNHRKHCRSLLWAKNGFIQKSIEHFNDRPILGAFISIYPHNLKLKQWAKRLSQTSNYGQMGVTDSSVTQTMQSFKALPEPIFFNGVSQYIFYKKLDFNPNSKEIEFALIQALKTSCQ